MRWDYRILVYGSTKRSKDVQEELRRLGGAGWELVSVISWETRRAFYLKKPIGDK